MNWKEIEKNCPKVAKLIYNEGYDFFHQVGYGFEGHNSVRNLYDFFDEQDIYISIMPSHTSGDWGYSIWGELIEISDTKYSSYARIDLGYGMGVTGGQQTRAEIEEAAFTKAFEILEEKLKNNSHE